MLVVVCAKAGLGTTMGCVERERQALLRFKHGLVDDYGFLSSWDTRDCCQWRGVQCSNHTGQVVGLYLQEGSLGGEISPSLLELELLTHLYLNFNDFEGSSIPPFLASLPKIQYLILSDANFTGHLPSQFGNLSNLLSLDLSGNYHLHSGNLEWLSHLSSLRHLDLNSVNLSKAIHWSQAINKLPSLIHLNLGSCGLPPLTTPFLSPVNSSAHLAFLDLSYNDFDLTSSIYPWLFNFTTTLVHLDLSSNVDLNGSISDAFGNMISLADLDISGNQLQGSIPDIFGNMTSLELLDLSENKLEGEIPKSLSNLCRLQELNLGYNNLSWQLPQVLDLLACANDTLEILYLSYNQLRGSIPDLTGFSSLRLLDLGYNQLNGTLPTSIGRLTKLSLLYISSNSLQGNISEAHLLHLSELEILHLSSNSLTFNIGLGWVPPFQLTDLQLTSCKLGPCFPSWLRTQKQLKYLDISTSDISDVIPHWFWNLTSRIYTFNISNNQITGTLPNLSSKFDQPIYIDMSSNYLEGSISELPSGLGLLDLANNKFSGSIALLCTVANSYLVHLDLSNNSLSGELPNCWPQWKSLTVLNLENNQFSGKIPKSFGSLQSIQTLHLRNNNLIGEFPSSLKKCKTLSLIDLAKNRLFGKIPPWIGGNLPNLTVLNLRSNKFSGSISPEICQLKKIQLLDLSGNNMSGTIPRCLSNFTAMTKKGSLTITYNFSLGNERITFYSWSYVDRELVKWKGREFEYKNTLGLVKSIDLSSNKLTGEIPKEVTDLLELVSLNFSRNNLTGLIPTTIGQLKSLDVLDLSQNQLIGEIPSSLSEIDRLSTLDLSNNNLSGKIPRGTQLQSFNASTYEGNPTLCGLPLLKKCPEDRAEGAPNASSYEDNIQQDGNDMWFYVSIALGFIVGFWGVCGTLLLNNSWSVSALRKGLWKDEDVVSRLHGNNTRDTTFAPHNATIYDLADLTTGKYLKYHVPTEFKGIGRNLKVVSFSSKKLTDLGFQFKYGDMQKGAIETCREKGLIPLFSEKEKHASGEN
ncbi:hypothetical protein PVL29_020661 [Vitis rotundifolia]|uniref:Leucine-rich repeat-containing N-terminal plant-type domain-containing protein n=1 Tax=Vitis rotundifolia TaxID=103349 RepID=A0AA38YXZ3_VITRO|nr:hypothetical protein PVL29_020661 [Vitis rotundifolia]